MAITTRQTSLLVQQDWTKIYQTFREANFQSFDFETIRKSMIDYLRTYYPEDFNDFTESSEYIALIDLIAFLGQSLAFRADLNARENFLDTAERRDSILKLAKLISYSPKRSTPASGFLKFKSISTTETIFDSEGNNLNNLVVNWNDVTNENWLEQFTNILNASLVASQAVGKPGSSQTLSGVKTDEYSMDILNGVSPVYPFTASIAGSIFPFEIVGATTANKSFVYEKDPAPTNAFNFLYRNDNQGNESNNTGYFAYFKQGELKSIDFTITESLPNRIVNINFDNINNTDVWLYTINTNGTVGELWTQVDSVNNVNVIYNNLSARNLYSVATRANDQIDLVFGDGSFTNIPIGTFRLYYRIGNNLSYKITPDEMSSVSIAIPYRGRTGRAETLTIRASLEYTITNATARETLEEIRTKAPQQYYTQNRMVTGEDYNILPYTLFNNILKVKAVNRTSSGISRYLDVIDSSGKYSSTNIFAQDGIIYQEDYSDQIKFQFTNSVEVNFIVQNTIKPLITKIYTKHLYYANATRSTPGGTWTETSSTGGQSKGTIAGAANYLSFSTGALIKFVAPSGQYFDAQNNLQTGSPSTEYHKTQIWASVISVTSPASATTPMTLSIEVPTGSIVSQVIPVLATDWSDSLVNSIINNVLSYKTFGIRYNLSSKAWDIVLPENLGSGDFSFTNSGDTSGTNIDNSWFIKLNFSNQEYTVTSRGQNYLFQSTQETRFYFDPNVKVYDSKTATTRQDTIKVLRTNTQPDSANSLFYSQSYRIWNRIIEADGYEDNRKILVTFPDDNFDGVPDDPDLFSTLVAPSVNANNKLIFFVKSQDEYAFEKYDPIETSEIVIAYSTQAAISDNISLYADGTVFYATAEEDFYVLDSQAITVTTDYIARVGRNNLMFQYTHNAPNNRRIDPSPNNLMDMFILTKSYSDQYQAYIQDTSNRLTEPTPPTADELKTEFSLIENYKALSDSLIYNSAVFKPLFGSKSPSSLQATFKVVKNPNVNISDNEIKSQVITALNNYFDVNNWDFGETFYFSELSAYLHAELLPNISSVIIVPSGNLATFGTLYQINAEPNEIIISAATVDNVQIISAITAGQLNLTTTG